MREYENKLICKNRPIIFVEFNNKFNIESRLSLLSDQRKIELRGLRELVEKPSNMHKLRKTERHVHYVHVFSI